MHYSRRPFDRLPYRREDKGTATLEQPVWLLSVAVLAASSNAFTLCDPVTLTFDLFDDNIITEAGQRYTHATTVGMSKYGVK